MYKLELTEEELLFLHDSCTSKIARLEEAHLDNIPRYHLSKQVLHKIYEARGLKNTTEDKF
jgi:predicted transcriptional regulator